MNDHRLQARGDAGPDYTRDVVPIGNGGHAGAAELEHDPGLTNLRHSGDRTCDLFRVAQPRAALEGGTRMAPVLG